MPKPFTYNWVILRTLNRCTGEHQIHQIWVDMHNYCLFSDCAFYEVVCAHDRTTDIFLNRHFQQYLCDINFLLAFCCCVTLSLRYAYHI